MHAHVPAPALLLPGSTQSLGGAEVPLADVLAGDVSASVLQAVPSAAASGPSANRMNPLCTIDADVDASGSNAGEADPAVPGSSCVAMAASPPQDDFTEGSTALMISSNRASLNGSDASVGAAETAAVMDTDTANEELLPADTGATAMDASIVSQAATLDDGAVPHEEQQE